MEGLIFREKPLLRKTSVHGAALCSRVNLTLNIKIPEAQKDSFAATVNDTSPSIHPSAAKAPIIGAKLAETCN